MHIPFVIIGGGVVGLLTAIEINKQFPDREIVLFEKGPFFGEHSTHRNSGVLHAGLYYPKESLKRKLCIEGLKIWRAEYSEFVNNCGKYLIASNTSEEVELDSLFNNAINNGVEELRWCDDKELVTLKEFINVSKAFFSSSTSVLNIGDCLKRLESSLQKEKVFLLKNQGVEEIEFSDSKYHIKTSLENLTSDFVINTAGLGAIDIRKKLGLMDFENEFVKGNYLKLKKSYYNESLLYPVPLPGLKGLGVHTSFGEDGAIRFGPNTEDVNNISYELREDLVETMSLDILKVFKGIAKSDLEVDYCGIRPKIKKDGKLFSDFYISSGIEYGYSRYIECLGIESPGLTSSPAIAKRVSEIVKSLI
jgi:L-2-hydroxyglutarate oxidase LhgO